MKNKTPFKMRIWHLLMKLPTPIYYRLLDLFTDNNGFRPLSMRYPEHFKKGKQ